MSSDVKLAFDVARISFSQTRCSFLRTAQEAQAIHAPRPASVAVNLPLVVSGYLHLQCQKAKVVAA